MPRPISTKTPLGVLRTELGISAAKMAEHLGVGTSTLQKIEQGESTMSHQVAKKISRAYWVDARWLLHGRAGDGVQSPVAEVPWTKEVASRWRLGTGAQMDEGVRKRLLKMGAGICAAFAALFESAIDDGKGLRVMTDAELTLDEILWTHYRIGATASPRPKEKRSSRKPRKRA
jgi:transcriptional regulator with XRE-family HTH domain